MGSAEPEGSAEEWNNILSTYVILTVEAHKAEPKRHLTSHVAGLTICHKKNLAGGTRSLNVLLEMRLKVLLNNKQTNKQINHL